MVAVGRDGHVGIDRRAGNHLKADWIIVFEKDGTFFVADDQEPTNDRSKALVCRGKRAAIREAHMVLENWGEGVRVERK